MKLYKINIAQFGELKLTNSENIKGGYVEDSRTFTKCRTETNSPTNPSACGDSHYKHYDEDGNLHCEWDEDTPCM